MRIILDWHEIPTNSERAFRISDFKSAYTWRLLATTIYKREWQFLVCLFKGCDIQTKSVYSVDCYNAQEWWCERCGNGDSNC